MKKANQTSYILPSTYKSIFLFSTLGKAMESVIATCVGYLTDKHSLFPDNYFGSLKGRSTVDVLLTPQKKVSQT